MRKLLITLLVSVLVLSFMSGCTPKAEDQVQFTKITATEDIPVKILENIQELNDRQQLQRGVWEFLIGDSYETERLYFMICGGRDYASGYDANITEVRRDFQDECLAQASASFWLTFSELHVDDCTEYSEDLEFPVVVFRADPSYGPEDSLNRSRCRSETANDYLIYQRNYSQLIQFTKILEAEHVPLALLDELSQIELHEGAWQFKAKASDGIEYLYYVVCGGSDYQQGFDVDTTVIKFNFGRGNPHEAYFTPYLTEITEAGIMPYSEGLEFPIVIFRIDSIFDEEDTIVEIATKEGNAWTVEYIDLTP